MNDRIQTQKADHARLRHPDMPSDGEVATLRLVVVAGFGLGLAALAVLAYTGGSLNITSAGIAMVVIARN
jgi:hypothetical protein